MKSLIVTYSNPKVERYFGDYDKLKQKIGYDYTRKVVKIINALEAAETFSGYLSTGYAKPHTLTNSDGCYGLSVSKNVRMVVKPNLINNSIEICTEVDVKGVCDYHGDKENWYIP